MRILFVLPAPVRVPMGGAAVVYRHAAGLAARGHEVTVAAPRRGAGVRGWALRGVVRLRDRWHGVEDAPLLSASGVRTREVATPSDLDALAYDSVIATGHQTAPWIHGALEGRDTGRVYLIQHDERYLSPAAAASWRLPFARVTIARWIADLLRAHGAPVEAVVPNAIDPGEFYVARALEDRPPRVIALYHRLAVKGPDTLVETLTRLKERVPELQADVLAARPPSHTIPRWATVHVRPDLATLRSLYNHASVCLHTSRLEGWGLVPMEAAACGCAVAATESRGVSEFLTAGRSMVTAEVGNAAQLAEAAHRLLTDREKRLRTARAGIEDVARFSWDDSTDVFEAAILASA